MGMIIEDVLNALPYWVWVKDKNSMNWYGNKALYEGTGLTKEQFVGKTTHELFSTKEANYHVACDEEVMKLRQAITLRDICTNLNGKTFHLETTKIPVIHGNDVVGTIGIARDVTGEQQLRDNLKDSISKLEELIERGIVMRRRIHSGWIGAILSVFMVSMVFGATYPKNMTEVIPTAPEVKSPTAFVTNLFSTTCVRVLSGDTFEVSGDKGKQTVRLANVTAPIEPQAYGAEAKKFLQHLIEGKLIALDALRWNAQQQLICHCYYKNTDIEILLVRAGLAYSHVAASVDLNLEQAQKLAQKERRGMWNQPIPSMKGKKSDRR